MTDEFSGTGHADRLEEGSSAPERHSTAKAERLRQRQVELDDQENNGVDVAIERRILNLETEIFSLEHDNTGAIVRERWGTDLAEKYSETGRRPLSVDADGRVLSEVADEQSHFLMVSLGELDRMNSEGGHQGGDLVLQNASSKIEGVAAAVLGESEGKFEIYRYGSNQFGLNLEAVTAGQADEIIRRVNNMAAADRLPDELRDRVMDAPPLVANRLSQAEAIGLLNRAHDSLRALDFGVSTSPADLRRSLIDVVACAGDLNQEMDKFIGRCQRVMEKIQAGGDAAAFFEQYMKKGLVGSEFGSLESFQNWFDMAAGQPKAGFVEAVRHAAGDAATRWLTRDRQQASSRQSAIIAAALESRGLTAPTDLQDKSLRMTLMPEALADSEELSGRAYLAELSVDLERWKSMDPNSPETRVAELTLEKERLKRDGLTGLERRRRFYYDLRERLTPDASGQIRDTSVVFVDMGYLKYFDREGGSDVGDKAIMQAAGIFEATQRKLKELGIEVMPRRYGADEFVFTVDGDMAKAQIVTETLAAQVDSGAVGVPGGRHSSQRYLPARLVFNFGVADTAGLRQAEERLAATGALPEDFSDSPEVAAKWRSETLTQMADAGIKEQKAVSRMLELYRKLTDDTWREQQLDIGAAPEQVDAALNSLFDYSQKATFNNGETIRQWAREGLAESVVVERARLLAKESLDAELHELNERQLVKDLTIEAGVREIRYERLIAEQQAELARLRDELGAEHELVESLRQQVARLEQEKSEMIKKYLARE